MFIYLLLFLIALILLIFTLWALSSTPAKAAETTEVIPSTISPTSITSPLKEAPFPCYLMVSDGPSINYLTDTDGTFKLTNRIEEATMYTYHHGHGDFLRAKGYHHSISKYWDETYANGIDFLEGPDYIIELNYVTPYNAHALIRTLVQDPAQDLYLIVTEGTVQIQNHPLSKITEFTIPNYIYNFEF